LKILAFDTATPVTSVAVGVDGAVAAEISITGDKAQMERLMPMIDGVLREARVGIGEIEGVAVGAGPGLFTALRIGVTTANTMSQVLRVPVLGLSSLDILATGVAYKQGLVAAAIDARRGEIFAALYEADGAACKITIEPEAVDPAVFAAKLAARRQPVTLAGDGFMTYREIFKEKLGKAAISASPEFMYPRASVIISMAGAALIVAKPGEPGILLPAYMRSPDADEHIKKMRR